MLDAMFAGFLNSAIVCDLVSPQEKNSGAMDPKAQVESKICSFFSKNFEHVKLTSLKVIGKQGAEAKGIQALYEPLIESPLAGRVKISWLVKLENDQIQQLSVIYSLEAFKNVPVFNKTLAANQELHESDIDYRSVNVAPYFGLKNFYQESLSGKMLLKKVTKGSYIFLENISDSALIKVNDEITLVIKSGGLSVSTSAIALENGYNVKDSIKVRVKETGATMSANIQTEKIAYVEI